MSKAEIFGLCKICGNYGKLSNEHIPPQKAFNDRTTVRITDPLGQWLKVGPDMRFKGPQEQGGASGHSLCGKCNNDTGGWYARAYIDWSYSAVNVLINSNFDPKSEHSYKIFPLRCLKQVITMMFSVNGDGFRDAHQDLVRFVLQKECRDIPNTFRIFLYYTTSPLLRRIGQQVMVRGLENQMIVLSEISHPPFGFVLTVDSIPPDERLFEITGFSSYGYFDHCSVTLLPPILPTDSIYPGDYRNKEQIKRSAA